MKPFTSRFKRNVTRVAFFSLLSSAFILFSFSNDPDLIQKILKKVQVFHEEHPQEKLYLHFDKPFYAAGENVWFKAYLVEASMHSLDSQSRVVYVELIDNTKTILKRQVLYVSDGVSFGDLQLSDSLQQGKYLIRAYTNYMKNAGEDYFFAKEFSILNATATQQASPEVTFDRDSIDLQFFPEGGNLVAAGTFNRVAFKAMSPDGKSIAVEGDIVDENNSTVASFRTQHDGMGMFQVNPGAGKKYFANITKPYKVNRSYPLPSVHEKGYLMQVTESGPRIKVVVFCNEDKPSVGNLTVSLIVQSRGNVYHAQQAAISGNAAFTYIPRAKLPDGITQITLFDKDGKPVAERLIYQDHHETMALAVKSDAPTYKKRELVTIDAEALYRNGTPAEGNFSIAVYDEGLLVSPEKYPLTINNYLSLTSDLKGHIENPGYYFKDSLPETKKHLDLLMMVSGWRRFTWKEVLEDNRAPLKHTREKGIPIRGRVLKPLGKNAPDESNLKIMTMRGDVVIVKPDSLGRFYTDEFLYYDTMKLVIQTENEKGKKKPYRFFLDPFNPSPLPNHQVSSFTPFDASRYLEQQYDQNVIDKAKLSDNTKVLKEVEVTAKRERAFDSRTIGFRGEAIDVKDIGERYQSIFQMLQARVPGLWITGNPPNMTATIRGRPPVFLMNGMTSSADMVNMISPAHVEMIEVVKGAGASVFGATSIINVVLKAGAFNRDVVGVNKAIHPGFYQAREFYAPRYDVPDDRHNLPDKRTTLYWNPIIKTNSNGKASVFFYAADVSSRYRVVIEGLTPSGYPGTAEAMFEVK